MRPSWIWPEADFNYLGAFADS